VLPKSADSLHRAVLARRLLPPTTATGKSSITSYDGYEGVGVHSLQQLQSPDASLSYNADPDRRCDLHCGMPIGAAIVEVLSEGNTRHQVSSSSLQPLVLHLVVLTAICSADRLDGKRCAKVTATTSF